MKIQSLKDYINESSAILRAFFSEKYFWRYFFALVIIYLIAYGALIRGDIFFRDDWWRSYYELDWSDYSRYFAIYLYKLFSVFKFADIAPLTQIIAFFILALSSLIIIKSTNHQLSAFNILAVAPLALSPFYAEIISYRFDALTISFAVFFAVLPFLFAKNKLIFFTISAVSLVLMYCTYQASNGVFLVVGLYLALRIYLSSGFKDSMKFLGTMFGAFIVASLFYKIFIVVDVRVALSYASGVSLPAEYLIPGIFRNIVIYFYSLSYALRSTPFFYFSLGLILFFIFGAISEDSKNRAKSLIASILFIICALSLSYGAYIVLLKPLMASRAFIGFGAFVAVISLFCVNFKARLPKILSRVLIICSTYSLIVFINAYGNALTAQNKYLYFRNTLVLQDLIEYAKETENSGIATIGKIGFAPQTQRFFDVYSGVAEDLIRNLNDNIIWLLTRLRALRSPYDYLDIKKNVRIASRCWLLAPYVDDMRLLVSTPYHDIYETHGFDDRERCYLIEYHELND